MFQVKEKSMFLYKSFFLLSLPCILSMAYFPRSQEIGQQSQICVYYVKDKHNGQEDWASHVHLLEPSVPSRKIKIIAEAYLGSLIIAKKVGLKKYFYQDITAQEINFFL